MVAFAIVFGAFAGNVLAGAMKAVPKAQVETAEAYGMTKRKAFWRIVVPQMWVYALPGLSNPWMGLIKSTPLLFLLGINDIAFWARELGAAKAGNSTDYPHGDWRIWYFLSLLIFYLLLTKISELLFERFNRRLTFGQATVGGAMQKRGGP